MPLALAACVGCSADHASGDGTPHGSTARAATTRATPSANPHTADPDPRHLALGDCFTAGRATVAGGVLSGGPVHIVPCTGPHLAEVFGRFTYVGGPYPTAREIGPTADIDCANLATRYDMDSWTLAPAVDPVRFFLPTRAQWNAGDHDGVCYWAPRPGPTTVRLRRDETTLTADQYAYLDAAERPESALAQLPLASRDDDLNSYRNWTAGVADSFTTEEQLLDRRRWSARAQAPVDALVRRLRVLAPMWRAASQSPSVPDIKRRVRAAQAQGTTAQERAARAALGLTTSRAR